MRPNTILILVVSVVIITLIFIESNNSDSLTYSFYDLNGELVDFNEYKGKYSILTFTFTRCPSICPMINYELNKLRFKYQDNINIISINVDPNNDTPENIRNFISLNQYEWDHITGDISESEKVMKNMLYSDRSLENPMDHLPNLHLMNADFEYIEDFFPVEEDVKELMIKLDSLIQL
tara:strand:- start:500 stop:1033 length:534 start_codon:yes stop_codon:yes gene_type:complete